MLKQMLKMVVPLGVAMAASKIKGGNMHETGAVKLDPNEPGVNVLPDGKIALTEQVVAAIAEEYAGRKAA